MRLCLVICLVFHRMERSPQGAAIAGMRTSLLEFVHIFKYMFFISWTISVQYVKLEVWCQATLVVQVIEAMYY